MKTLPIDAARTTGALLIVGPFGSGKTTALCERYVDLVRTGERGLLMLVHSRRQARVLADRILRRVGRSTDQVRVLTWHAFALNLVRAHHRALGYRTEPALLTADQQFFHVRELLRSREEQRHWAAFPRQLRLAGFVEELREFVLRAQDGLFEPEELEERARMARRDDLAEAARFFRRYLTSIDDNNVVDHANVIALTVALMQRDQVAAGVREETRHLLVDDYQDCTPAQVHLLRALFREHGSVAVAANPAARIYGFRGASADSIAHFEDAFGPGVLRADLPDVRRDAPERRAWLFDHVGEEADAIARECRRLEAREGIAWGEIAIVVRRYGAVSRAIRRSLERAGVPVVVVGENRPLAHEPALRPMLDLVRAALRVDEREERLPALLASPVGGLDPYEVRQLRREARLRDTSLTTLVTAPPPDLPEEIRARLQAIAELFEEIRSRVLTAGEPAEDTFWFLWERLRMFRDMVERGDQDELDAVVAFARAVEAFSERPGLTFDDYLSVLEGVEFGPEPWNMPEQRRPNAVRLTTAHHSVGAEFDAAIVAGCVEGEFPDPNDRRAMLDIRDLLDRSTPSERARTRLDEERRLFGVATSRARRSLLLTAATETTQRESAIPTPFVAHLGSGWSSPPPAEPLTRDEAEAVWRRTLSDSTAPAEHRTAALEALARLPGVDPDAWWWEKDWTDPGVPMAPEQLLTSYSRLDKYENCPLQYLYAVELGLDPETTHHMTVGTWVHDIVDACAQGRIPATEEALLAELDRVWDPGVFPSVAVEHRRRIDSEEMLRRWLRVDGATQPLASEVAFEFPIDGATMRGRIDRIVRLGTKSVRVTDYKTARDSKQQDEVEADLQLASYYLAVKRDPNLAVFGEPAYLELAYLGAFWQDGFVRKGFEPKKVPGYEQDAERRLVSFVDGIKREEFHPSPSADCRFCKFKVLCPVWPEGDEVRP